MPHNTRERPFSFLKEECLKIQLGFKKAGFDEKHLIAALGVKGIPALRSLSAETALERTVQISPLNTLIRLFIIGAPASAEAIREAFPDLSVERLSEGGLLKESGDELPMEGGEAFFATVKVTPISGLWIAFDRSWFGDCMEEPDHVMGPSDTARMLAALILRTDGELALDIGSGCGYLAFLASKTNKRVIATDLNPRAAAFVAFNAAINGIENVEARTGDLFQPVQGEKFDLVISNPPFVISPEDRLIYLNGGMPADAFCKRIAKEAPAFLREGASLQMLCNWVEKDGQEWQQGLEEWFTGSGCDTWVLRSSTTDPVVYAKNWMQVGRIHSEDSADHTAVSYTADHAAVGNAAAASKSTGKPDDANRLEKWLEYYRQEHIASIGAGTVTMRKHTGTENWYKAFDGPGRVIGPCGDITHERMESLDFLARHAKEDQDLMASVFRMSDQMRFEQEEVPMFPTAQAELASTAPIFIQILAGFAYREEIDDWFSALILACDGQRTLRHAMDKAAQDLGMESAEIPVETAEIVRQLVDEGFLLPVRNR